MTCKCEKEKIDNVVCICIDKKEETTTGRIYNCYYQSPAKFEEVSELFFSMDKFFDKINFPQASLASRAFVEASKNSTESRKELKKVMSSKDVKNQKGAKGTFVVHVQYRQNSTWQGNVVWAERNISKNFRSALELLKLIDGALDETETEDE